MGWQGASGVDRAGVDPPTRRLDGPRTVALGGVPGVRRTPCASRVRKERWSSARSEPSIVTYSSPRARNSPSRRTSLVRCAPTRWRAESYSPITPAIGVEQVRRADVAAPTVEDRDVAQRPWPFALASPDHAHRRPPAATSCSRLRGRPPRGEPDPGPRTDHGGVRRHVRRWSRRSEYAGHVERDDGLPTA